MTLISLHLNKLLAGIALFFGVLVLAPWQAHAQESVVLSVSPTLFEMTANPDQTWSSSVRVINANPFPITVSADVVNFAPTGVAGQGTLIPVIDQEATGDTLAEWINVAPGDVTIPAEQTVNVPFTIAVPDRAAPGGHFAAILVGTKSVDGQDGQAQVETSQVVSSLVFLTVAGDIIEDGLIREFTTTKRVYESADANFTVRFENRGNVHIQPQGDIEIRNMWGQLRGSVAINKNSQFGNVLPESIRAYNFQWTSEWSLIDVGRHTAIVTLAYGEDVRQFVDAKTYFWIIPWKLLLLATLVIGGFIALMVWAIKLYIRRMLQLAGVTPELSRQSVSRQVSVTAPIEAGILDLRNELEHGDGSSVQRIWSFIRLYKVAALLVGAVVVFIVLLIWYGVLLVTNDYSYQVSYERQDGVSVPLEGTDTAQQDSVSNVDAIEVIMINHTNVRDAKDQIESKLPNSAYTITERYENFDVVKERSVLVFDPEYVDVVTELQELLPGILVSSYVSDDPTDPPLTLYVGTDILQ